MYQILCLCEEGTGFEETYMYMISCSDSPKVISLMSLRPSVEDLHHMTEPLLVDASQHQLLQIQEGPNKPFSKLKHLLAHGNGILRQRYTEKDLVL